MRIKPINHLSNRNHEYCILHTIAIIHITNQSIPTVFAILSSIVVKQDKSPFDRYKMIRIYHYHLNRTALSTLESKVMKMQNTILSRLNGRKITTNINRSIEIQWNTGKQKWLEKVRFYQIYFQFTTHQQIIALQIILKC